MNRSVVVVTISAVCVLILAGCGMSESVVVTGIEATNAKNQMQSLKNIKFKPNAQIAKNKVTEAIASYQASTGFLPTSLQVLIDEGYLPALPALPEGLEFHYNHVTGEVSTGPPGQSPNPTEPNVPRYMMGPGPGQYGSNQYGGQRNSPTAVPNYPARPAAPRGGRRNGRGGGGGMGGPMGSAMTGIGIQNQLDSMSNAGSSSAGSYARHGINQRVNNYNDRETKTLNELGF